MEIRTLRYFLAVAREENMTRAAEILHVTQPTLSKALKSLEDELGKKLFVRHSFSIRLTEEGVLLRNRAEDLVSMADKIEQEFISLDDISGGELYLGLAESYQIRYLARVIKDFKTRYPNLHYHITGQRPAGFSGPGGAAGQPEVRVPGFPRKRCMGRGAPGRGSAGKKGRDPGRRPGRAAFVLLRAGLERGY